MVSGLGCSIEDGEGSLGVSALTPCGTPQGPKPKLLRV